MEIVSAIGGSFLSAAFKLLLQKLDSSELLNLEKKFVCELRNWKTLLPKIIVVLKDAEEKEVTDRAVRLWLADLKDLARDMEDVLEKFEIDSNRCNMIENPQSNTGKVRKFFSSCCKGLRFTFDRETASKVKDITTRLQHFATETKALGLITLMRVEDGERSKRVDSRRPLTSSLPESHVYGRESDKEAVLQMLLSDEDFVIPIVGIQGVGKTTLAQLVYNDEKLKGRFELKAWVCVSNDFDLLRITRTILQQVTKERCDFQDFSLLQERLKGELSGKKFLLVLDDVWNLNYNHWDILQRLFIPRVLESKIIVTTQDKDVGRTMRGNDKVYHLKLLPDDACLLLLARHALGTENFVAHPSLKGISEEIVKKCKGLPFSVKIVSGLLRGNLNCNEWKDILNSKIWDLSEDQGGILPAIRMRNTK